MPKTDKAQRKADKAQRKADEALGHKMHKHIHKLARKLCGEMEDLVDGANVPRTDEEETLYQAVRLFLREEGGGN